MDLELQLKKYALELQGMKETNEKLYTRLVELGVALAIERDS